MSGIKDQENIDELRKRLYDRQTVQANPERHGLSDSPVDVSRDWKSNEKQSKPTATALNNQTQAPVNPNLNQNSNLNPSPETKEHIPELNLEQDKPKHSYRWVVILASLGLFIVSALASIIFLFFGGNEISTKNVNITMEAPFAVAAGDILPLQLSLTNQNTVPIESAILILNYPSGTKSADDARDLFEERMPIDDINPGEAVNIPLRVALFGEENEEREIKATIEYRVKGSNGTFFKDAEPVIVKINSSPLVLRIESVDKISSGQDIEVRMILQSNATTPLKNILIKANYPNTFAFVKADPSPDYGQDSWLVDEISPEEQYEIVLNGLVTGVTDEVSEIQFTAGNPESGNKSSIGSLLTQTKTDYIIESPFIDVDITVNQERGNEIVLDSGADTNVRMIAKNTLTETLYDMRVELSPSGSVVREDNFDIQNGFYDPNTNDLRWEISGMSSLEQVNPGENRTFTFSVSPDSSQPSGTFDISAEVFARRVNEGAASEELIGTAIVRVKYSSEIAIKSTVGHSSRPFDDSGPVPPVAGERTTYTIELEAVAGVNDLTDVELNTSLPQYVKWLNNTEGDGNIEYNSVAKRLFWNVGDISANQSKSLKMQVELLPSTTHINRVLPIILEQELKAKDDFSGATINTLGKQVSSDLSNLPGFGRGSGIVQKRE